MMTMLLLLLVDTVQSSNPLWLDLEPYLNPNPYTIFETRHTRVYVCVLSSQHSVSDPPALPHHGTATSHRRQQEQYGSYAHPPYYLTSKVRGVITRKDLANLSHMSPADMKKYEGLSARLRLC